MFINEKAPHTTVSDGLIIMCLNTAVNFLLMWYIRNVFPDHHGNPQPYYFCFTRSYWRLEGCPEIPALPQSEEHLFESVPRRLTPVISSRGLMKLVNDEPVVAGVSINLYRSEVTVIVGNKYSGKTTLINLLAGIIPASSGVVTINGHNVAKERRRLNHITGYCTQHDVLFRKLTCLEHLTFYLKLKGHYSAHYENWNSELLRCIGLGEQSDNYPWMLNVGERRKLTIACSFVGENQAVSSDNLKDQAVSTDSLKDQAVSSDNLKDQAVSSDNLKDQAVSSDNLKDQAVSSDNLKDQAVSSDNLKGQAVSSDNLKDQAVSSDNLKDQAVSSDNLKDQAVSSDNLKDQAVSSDNLKDQAVSSDNLKDQAVSSDNLKDQAVSSDNLKDQAVSSDNLKDQAVSSDNLKDQAVSSDNLKDQAVSLDNLKDQAVSSDNLKDQAVSSDNLKDQAVSSDNLKDQAVSSDNLKDQAVSSDNLKDQAVSSDNLKDQAVSSDNLKDQAVSSDNLKDQAVSSDNLKDQAVSLDNLKDQAVSSDNLKDQAVSSDNLKDQAVSSDNLKDQAVSSDNLKIRLYPQIIFLDEPTYGLNAKAKKDVCHFLQNMKQGRTILMSTHSMDEAETLADRIAIIEEGGVKCYGSPAFLKRIFGVGYHLKVTREPGCSIKNLLKTVQTIFPEATFSGSNSTEVTISLPEGLDFFIPNFLEQLDKRTDDLKISNIRLSAFSLYDVFHGLGEGFELRENIDSAHSSICETMEEQNEFDKDGFLSERLFKRMGNYEQYTGSRLILQQLKAIFFKKWILFTRPLITALAILFLPAGVVLFGIGLDQDTMSASDVKPLEFSLRGLEDTLIPIWKNDSTAKAKLDSYEKQFQSVGSHVMSPSQKDPNEFFIYWANKYDDERYNKKFIFGVELTIPDTTIIFYQHWMTQAQGVAVQIMINSEIVTALGENYSVQTGVEYVQSFEEQLYLKMQVKTIACIAIVMCLVPLLLVTEVIFERTNGARHLQSVSGVNTCVFWLGTYIFDLLVYLFVAATIVLALMYSPEYYIRCGHWNATITLLLVFGLTVFPYLYAFQSVFYTAITGSITMLIYNTFMGLLMSMVIALTKIYAQSMKDYLGLIDNLLGAVSPNYLLSYSLLTLVSRTVKSTVNGTCVSHSWPNETRLILNMEMFVVQFIISWLMIACVEYEIYSKYILPMYQLVCCSKDKNMADKVNIFSHQQIHFTHVPVGVKLQG
ncbi:ATP-binding cassette sub-family A member 17-like [Physella acuta]|uniref:ATP-binding cassette sub-family A member 17-like n=1 Tax=Physella acuta TaxID=109671 RepID=UPI0027DDADF1|nr:ATP-binding cassette sub-family A member 17-like [Physella acuta]